MNKIALFCILLAPFITSCSSGESAALEVSKCVDRGVQYFKDIGSYPTLNSAPNKGRSAETVARERCKRTTTAF